MSVKIDPKSIAIALTAYYPKWYIGKLRSIKHTDKIRGDLAIELIGKATTSGYQIVVVDGKSSSSFRKALRQFLQAVIKFRRSVKRSPAKRQAFKAASKIEGVKVIVATEPEKVSLIENLDLICSPILSQNAEIVVPKREKKLFEQTYPNYMYESEIEGNQLYNQYLKVNHIISQDQEDFDFFFGPKVFKNDPKILRLFMKKFKLKIGDVELPKEFLDPEELSNASFFPIILALRRKFKVKSVIIPFFYPDLQKENEETGAKDYFVEKRRNQRLGLLIELLHFLSARSKH